MKIKEIIPLMKQMEKIKVKTKVDLNNYMNMDKNMFNQKRKNQRKKLN